MTTMSVYIIVINLRMVETRITALVIGQKVMMERGIPAAPDATIAMTSLAMNGIAETFSHYAPLHGEVLVGVERRALIDRP